MFLTSATEKFPSSLLETSNLVPSLRNKDFLLHWEQTNVFGFSSNIHILRSALDFHIKFIFLYLLLSFSGFMLGCLKILLHRTSGGQVMKELMILINPPALS